MRALTLCAALLFLATASTASGETPDQTPRPSVVSQRDANEPRAYRATWLAEAVVGAEQPMAASAEWLDGVGEPVGSLRLSYGLDHVAPGLFAHLGLGIWKRGRLSQQGAALSLLVSEAELGATWQWPRDGLWNWLYPYARASLLLGYWRVRAGNELGDDLWFRPGLRGALGLRMHLGQLVQKRGFTSGRPYLFGEASLAGRLAARPKLAPLDEDDEDPLLPGRPTRIGSLDLSGWSWSVGFGVAL